jgi:hypothetical protein
MRRRQFLALTGAVALSSVASGAQAQVPQMPFLVAIRAAHHPEATPKYDRVVFEFRGTLPNRIGVQYVNTLRGDGSGLPIQIKGNAILQLTLSPAVAHTDNGTSSTPERIRYRLPIIQEVVRSGDFEAVVTHGIGVSRKTEIRFLTLDNPTRVVIDFILP